MSSIKYLLDEHVGPQFRFAVHGAEPEVDVVSIGDPVAPPLGTPDPDILDWCEEHDFILVTNNRASMPIHLRAHLEAGRHVPGVFVLKGGLSLRDTADELVFIWGASLSDEYRDLLRYLPISRQA